MKQHGRKSAARLALVAGLEPEDDDIPKSTGTRPGAPKDLTVAQAKIWHDAVAGEPVEFFQAYAVQNMLKDYARHVDAGNQLSELIDAFRVQWLKKPDGQRRYEWLLKMRAKETAAASALATKLRLTNQARWRPQEKPAGPAPWDE